MSQMQEQELEKFASALNLLSGSSEDQIQIAAATFLSFFGSLGGAYLFSLTGLQGTCFPYGGPECFTPKQYISPAGWAFSIWGIIYAAMGLFMVYLAIPSSLVPSRNDELVLGDIGYNFAVNIFLNILWLQIYPFGTLFTYILSLIEIIMMLVNTTFIMMKSTRTSVNAFEWITLRGGMSIYAGWLTAATILNTVITIQRLGFVDPDLPFGNEQQWTAVTLWVAFIVYEAGMISEKNPIFGAVFVWVLFAIIDEQKGFDTVTINAQIILVLHILSIVGLSGFMVLDLFRVEQPGFWEGRGLLY